MSATCAVITVSDRCSRGVEADLSGPHLRAALEERGFCGVLGKVVPDDIGEIYAAIRDALTAGARFIITTGGTGIGPRDVTPQATAPFIATPLPALEQFFTQESLKETHYAALSRGHMGLTATEPAALIVNIPGSLKAAKLAERALFPLLKHTFDQLDQDDRPEGTYADHE